MIWVLNPDTVGTFRRLAGNAFQTDGATKLNERSSKDFKLLSGILKSFLLEDRRRVREV